MNHRSQRSWATELGNQIQSDISYPVMLGSKKTEGSDGTMYSVETNGLQMAGILACIEEIQRQVSRMKIRGKHFHEMPCLVGTGRRVVGTLWAC